MGLDVSFYATAARLRDIPESGEYDYDGGETALYVNPEFPVQADDLTTGIYSVDAGGHIGCGAYSRYNRWRDQLAALAGYGSAEAAWRQSDGGRTEGPFWELINFSDCEGVIGPRTSAKLAKDFSDFAAGAANHADEYFREKFTEWRNAFETAGRGGAVHFH